MTDLLHASLKWIDHNRYVASGALLAGTTLLVLTACEPKAVSPFDGQPATQSQLIAQAQSYQAQLNGQLKTAELTYQQTLAQLQVDAASHQAKAQAALEDIEQRKQAIRLAIESIAQFASTAAGPQYASMLGSAVGIAGVLLGAGAAADSRRKDQVILTIKGATSDDAGPNPASSLSSAV